MSNKLVLQLLAVVALIGIEMNLQAATATPKGPAIPPVYLLNSDNLSGIDIREVLGGNIFDGGATSTTNYSLFSQMKAGHAAAAYALQVNTCYILSGNNGNGLYIQIVRTENDSYVVLAWQYSNQAQQIISNASVVETNSSGLVHLHADSNKYYISLH